MKPIASQIFVSPGKYAMSSKRPPWTFRNLNLETTHIYDSNGQFLLFGNFMGRSPYHIKSFYLDHWQFTVVSYYLSTNISKPCFHELAYPASSPSLLTQKKTWGFSMSWTWHCREILYAFFFFAMPLGIHCERWHRHSSSRRRVHQKEQSHSRTLWFRRERL